MAPPTQIQVRPRLTLADVANTSLNDLPHLFTNLHEHLSSLPSSVMVSQTALTDLHATLADLRSRDPNRALPLHGVPYVAKDNIDAPPHATTNGCAATSRDPVVPATVISRLEAAGAVLLGKANMDQFATGLVGTRSPRGVVPNAEDARFVSGGSSSGSATAVAAGAVAFALATDTAGSGRVPAAMQRLVGLKPTRGALSCAGVAPACRSLDCVGVLANSVDDAAAVTFLLAAPDEADPFSREMLPGVWRDLQPRQDNKDGGGGGNGDEKGMKFKFGVPSSARSNSGGAEIGGGWPKFDGDKGAEASFEAAVGELIEKLGGKRVDIDYAPFAKATSLLYDGPFVAERFSAVGRDIEARINDERWADSFDETVANIILSGKHKTATAVFDAVAELGSIRQRVERAVWHRVDVLVVPSVPRVVTPEEVANDPVGTNSMLGWYTNFVNLLDYCAVAVPCRPVEADELGAPRGITLIGRAFDEGKLVKLARAFESL